MRKKWFVMALAACFALATTTSCGGSKSNKENVDIEDVDDFDDEDDDFDDDDDASSPEEEAEANPVIVDFITDMYENHRYQDEAFLKKHCTQRLLTYLQENYDYDGEGYANWLFRTSSQDSKPGAEGTPDKVSKVTIDEDGWYHYVFTDAGWQGENKIKAFVENGKVMMDQLEAVYNEFSEYYE